MCYIWNTSYDSSLEPTLEQKKQLVKSLKNLVKPDFEFHLSGGEPLLSGDVLDLVSFIVQEGYKTDLVTNGVMIDEKTAGDIVRSGLDTVTISLDGIKAGTHDFIRGLNGCYQKVMKAIDYLDKARQGAKLKIALLTVIMGPNLDEILELIEWAQHDKRIEMISFQAITQPLCEARDDWWFNKEKSRFLWPEDIQKVNSLMDKIKELRLNGYKIGNHPNHFLHFKEYFKDPNTFLKKLKCNLGDYEFHIDPYGKIFFCTLIEPLGNIKNDNIAEIWNSPRAQKIRQDVYNCRKNCHIMINCFYEDEKIKI